MMRLSRASTYAVYGMAYLARQDRRRFVPISEILKHVPLPQKHLAKIFLGLVKGGLLRSFRGVAGGFALAKPPSEITALEIIRQVDGPVPVAECPIHSKASRQRPCCPVNHLMSEGRKLMTAILEKWSLSDLTQSTVGGSSDALDARQHH
jgi:Rrf2 family protein